MAATLQTLHALQSVLQRPDVWRGDQLAGQGQAGLSSGFPVLDAELPGSGWPRGALTELIPAHSGIGELALLQPALLECVKQAPVAVLAPPYRPHAPAWAASLPLERMLWIEASGKEVAWAAECLLDSGALGALLVWLPAQTDARALRRLQLARPKAMRHPPLSFAACKPCNRLPLRPCVWRSPVRRSACRCVFSSAVAPRASGFYACRSSDPSPRPGWQHA
ncbi:MAG: SOS cell division inhibitor [Uliginosibacterium sp.]|nr:SOS cell division inhibitor [Uliginosibacterium sp.]